jgi:hypothetical protein
MAAVSEQAHILVGDILGLARVDDADVERLQQMVLAALDRAQRQALLVAVTECETVATSHETPEVRVAVQQLAIRIAKLALAPQLAPMKGPRKANPR